MRVRRIDFASALAAPVRRGDGTAIVEARIARTGVQTYRNTDGSARIEYRPPDEVSKSMSSLRLVPVTNEHPPMMLNANNARSFTVGAIGENIRKDGQWIVAPLAIFDASTIAAMDAGKNQVSAGYECEMDETPGYTPDGERYDAVQRDITINHVAVVGNARAGKDAAARMDAAYEDAELGTEARNNLEAGSFAVPRTRKLPIENAAHTRNAMSRFSQTEFESDAEKRAAYHAILAAAHKFGVETTGFEQAHHMDAQEFDMDRDEQIRALKLRCDEVDKTLSERKDALEIATRERDSARAEVVTLKEQVTALTTKLAAGATAMESEAIAKHAERADKAETKLHELEAKRHEDIRRAAEMRLKAQAVMGPEFKCDGMPDRAVQCAVIRKLAPKDDTKDASAGGPSDAYIASRFDSLVEAYVQNARSISRAGEVLIHVDRRNPSMLADTPEARAKAWREQGPNGYRPHGQKE